MKNTAAVLLALVLGFAAGWFLAHKLAGPDPAYWIERGEHEAAIEAQDEALAAGLALVAEMDALIAERDGALAAREARIRELGGEAARNALEREEMAREAAALRADAQAAIDASPAVRALVENFELRLAAAERQIFTLSATIEEERAGTADWILKYDAAVTQRDEWRRQYEQERALRLSGDSLRLGLEKKLYRGDAWKWIALAEPVVFGLIVLFGGKG